MATSGSRSVTVTSWDTLKFSWEEASQSIANNTTTINWKLQLIAGSSGRISSTTQKQWNVNVNGKEYSGSTTVGIANNATKTLASGSTTITHNADGTKSFGFSFSQSFSGITFSGKALGIYSGSGSGTLDTIPRKSTMSVSGVPLGTALKLNVTKQSSGFTHTITYKCGTASGTICTKSSATSISWTPPLSLASQAPALKAVTITFTITTYNGSTSLGSNSYTTNCGIPSSVAPSCSVAVSDPTGYADKYGAYIKGLSKFKVVITPTLAYGSAITSYSSSANGSKYTAANFTTAVLNSSGSLKITATVKDQRGRTGTSTVTKEVYDYSTPQITIESVERCDKDGNISKSGDYIAVRFSCEVTSLNNQNTASYTAQYKKTTDEEYTVESLTDYENQYSITDGLFVFPAVAFSTYDILITAQDDFVESKQASVGKSVFKLWSIFRKYLGIAFGKYAELEGVFDIGFQTRFFGGILHMVLEAETDLNEVRTPNTYVGANVSTYNYSNCPITSGTFTLEVVGCGEEGQVKQRIQTCSKAQSKAYERFYYQGEWGEWICVSDFDGALLWSGGYYMTAGHVIALAEPISKQKSGIVLVFSEFVDGAAVDQSFHTRFIPKMLVSKHSGKAECIQMSTSNLAFFATKYLYISDAEIKGHDNNNLIGTATSGITYTNNRFVLRYVIGV